ncbi:MAG: ABC transporter substrate-binding protein [Geobacteraceae bacterium]|nr:ABC transporter substrate-binding protein [Geobacteraceae bacterium]
MTICRAIPLLLLVLMIFTDAQSATAGTSLKKISLMPLWSPQAQFAGYYVALDKGIYALHGIDLKILKAGAGHSPAQTLKDGGADFVLLWLSTALQQRSAGVKLVNVAQMVQKSSMMLISKKSSGIKTVTDMNGKKVGLWGGDLSIPPQILFARHAVKVREIQQSGTVNLFLRGGIDVTSAMWYNEYHTLLNSGVDLEELNVLSLNEQGMIFPEDGIYTLEKTLKQDPNLARSFVAASLEGWRYAFTNPDEALDIVIKYMREAEQPANRIHQKWMLGRMQHLMSSGNVQGATGVLKEQDYQAVGNSLRKAGLIREYPEYSTFIGRSNAGEK